ncbi:MAG: DUF4174 domain-containing protein [Pseudomonadota bacterium]
MRPFLLAAVAVLAPMVLSAETAARAADASPVQAWEADPTTVFDAAEIDLEEFMWVARPIVVFANSPRDPAFAEQLEQLQAELDPLIDRDVVLVVDTDPEAGSDIRQRLRPRGFMMVLIGKDGQVKLRKPFPWTVRELSRSIDKMPMRQREFRERG